MRARIMIVPAGLNQRPAIREARAMGLRVLAMDRSAQACGLADANERVIADPANPQALRDAAVRFGPDGILSIANEPTVLPAATVSEELGLSTVPVSAARACRDKPTLRKTLDGTRPNLNPSYTSGASLDIGRAAEGLAFPLVVKPADGYGSRGVILAASRADLPDACRYSEQFATDGKLVAEERNEGLGATFDGILWNGALLFGQVSDRTVTAPPFYVVTSHATPSSLPFRTQQLVESASCDVAHTLNVQSGPIHAEYQLDGEQLVLVDFALRAGGGGLATHLLPLSSGANYLRMLLELALGVKPRFARNGTVGAAIQFADPPSGSTVPEEAVAQASKIPGVAEAQCGLGTGEPFPKLEHSAHRKAFAVATGKDARQAAERAKAAVSAMIALPQ